MKQKIRNTKIILYLLLASLTVICACLSYRFYEDELVSRTTPQVMRAMVQVSRLLPQLEENEQAVREVYDNLEKSRRKVYKDNEDTLEKVKSSGENAETVIQDTLSWMNRVTMLRVGRRGHVIVVSRDDDSILAHPDEQFVGEALYPIGNVDLDSIPDISEVGRIIDPEKFHAFFPSTFFRNNVSPKRFYEAADAGIYGMAFTYKNTYVVCGVTLFEAFLFVIVRTFFTTLFFFLAAWVFVRYIGFSLGWQKADRKEFRSKLAVCAVLAVTLLFAATWYYQTMMDVTGDIATMNEHAQVAIENLNTYKQYRNELSKWLDDQYLEQCRLAADLVKGTGKENLTRQDLAEYAKELGVRYIYVFDKKGKVMVTNSPYDHFELSRNEGDQSYAFLPLLEGKEYVIQEPQKDDAGGEMMQYIGVSLRDEEDLADGFVQIAVDPGLRERLLEPINVQTVLDNLVIGLPEYALAVDKSTMQIVATTGMGFEKENVEELGIEVENLKSDFSGSYEIKGNTYYAGVSESDDLYLMPLTRSTDNKSAFFIALMLGVFNTAAFVLLVITALFTYKKILAMKEAEEKETEGKEADGAGEAAGETAGDGEEAKKQGILHGLTDVIKVQQKWGFESRWKKNSAIPIEQRTPEMRTGIIIYRILLAACILLILFLQSVMSVGTKSTILYGFSYVLLGEWRKGINLFSVSYCLFLLCVLYVFQELINQILYHIARISDLKHETILLLLRNALKYACALAFLYFGLAKLGVDTRALWASVGVLSLIVGLGAKDLIGDVIAGLFIIFEGTYKIGDWVTVGSWGGTVKEIGLRYTKLEHYADTKIINNSSIRDIINCDGETARQVLKFPVSYETDLLEIEKLLESELPEMAKRVRGIVKPPKYQGINSFEDSYIMLRIAIYCHPWYSSSALRAMRREIKLLFDREHISMPYNHLVVKDYAEEDSDYTFTPKDSETGEESK